MNITPNDITGFSTRSGSRWQVSTLPGGALVVERDGVTSPFAPDLARSFAAYGAVSTRTELGDWIVHFLLPNGEHVRTSPVDAADIEAAHHVARPVDPDRFRDVWESHIEQARTRRRQPLIERKLASAS